MLNVCLTSNFKSMKINRFFFFLLVLLVFSEPVRVHPLPAPPKLQGYVNDDARMLTADQAQTLERLLAGFERETTHQLVVLTVPSLYGEDIEGFSMRVAEAWKIGKKGKDDGVIMIVAPSDRRVRIEVGYGLEGTLTDAKSSRIIREAMLPRFSSGDYYDGILAGVQAIRTVVSGESAVQRPSSIPESLLPLGLLALFIGAVLGMTHWVIGVLFGSALGLAIPLLLGMTPVKGLLGLLVGGIIGLIAPFFLRLLFTPAMNPRPGDSWFRRTRGWNGGFGGSFPSGGVFGGGGGSFGGGGASGQW